MRAPGHGSVLATRETLDIMALRYGEDFAGTTQAAALGEPIAVNGVTVDVPSGRPCAGLGADRGRAWTALRIVASGDYKRRARPDLRAFEPVACDVFITEATFGAAGVPPSRPTREEIARLLALDRSSFPSARIWSAPMRWARRSASCALLREAGYDEPIYIHGALAKLSDLLRRARASTSASSKPATLETRRQGAISPAPSSSARPRPSPTAGRGASPIRSPASPRAGCASASAPSSAASNCR